MTEIEKAMFFCIEAIFHIYSLDMGLMSKTQV